MASEEPNFQITYYDRGRHRNRVALIKERDFDDQLDKLRKALDYMLGKMQKLGDYEISEFTAKAELQAGVPVLKATGSIEMKWTKPKK